VAVLNIVSWSITNDVPPIVTEHVIGHRYACQRCPHIYSVSPAGTFDHHCQSSPLTPEVPAPPIESEPPTNGVLPPGYERPVPKARPRV